VRQKNHNGILDDLHINGKLRPQVTHLEQERLAEQERRRPRGKGLKDGRRSTHHEIRILHLQRSRNRAEHKADVGKDARKITMMQGRRHKNAQHPHPVQLLFGGHAAMLHDAPPSLVVHVAGDDHHFMSALAQILRHFKMTGEARLVKRDKNLIN
jgi:hypothetical protein